MISKVAERALRKHMAFVPGGEIDLDPVEHQEIEVTGNAIMYDARAGKVIKPARYIAFYVPYLNGNNRLLCVYGFMDDRKLYTYVSHNDIDQ